MALKKILKNPTHFEAVQALYDSCVERTERELARELKKAYKDVLAKTKGIYYELLESSENGTILMSDYYRYGSNYKLAEELQKKLTELTGKEEEIFETRLTEMYEEVTGLIGRELQVMPLSKERAVRAVNSIWCQDGKLWSSRLWTEKNKLVQMVEEGMLKCVSTGASSKELAKDIQTAFGVKWSDAQRLARTELAHIMNQSSVDSYKEAGVKFYRVLNGGNPCPICDSYKDQLFPITELVLPSHPRCVCCTIAADDDGKTL